jgi:oligopeptidase B
MPRFFARFPARSFAFVLALAMTASAFSTAFAADTPVMAAPPLAGKKPYVVKSPNGDREDPYYWLRDDTRKNPDMLAYLNAENAWFAQYAAHYKGLEDKLFEEVKGRIKQDDSTVPAKKGDWWYYTRFVEGKEYPVVARRKGGATYDASAPEVVLLDENALAAGHDFYQVGGTDVSPSQKMLAYAEDTVGRRQYTIRFKNLETGEVYADTVANVSGDLAWASDDRSLFYVENDPKTLRSYRVRKHVLGTDAKDDAIAYEEKDEAYYTSVHRSSSEQYIVISLESTESDEQRILRADTPDAPFKVFAPRRAKFHYHAEHIATGDEGSRWIVRTDWLAPNYKLMQVADDQVGDRAAWKLLLPHSDKVFINNFDLFQNYFVVDERSDGLRRLRVVSWAGKKSFYIDSTEPAYTTSLGANAEQATDTLRYNYSSLTTPASVYEVDMKTGEKKLLKQTPVLGGFDAKNYVTERVWVTAKDGARVPVSLVYRVGFRKDGSAPLLQYGYGSYGLSMDPNFRSTVVSLLDRGFVYAIAHIRGGEEMGRAWYENGKKLKKKNTFTDFIAVTDALVRQGYAAKDKVFIEGGSAGGLLMGAVANMRPDLYRAVVAQVPFVDVVTTMLDESIPLTTNEFDEWGNPKLKTYYNYMLSYSPYDNVKPQAYPAMFVATGLFDSQVQYYEPAKWVAKLRELNTGSQPLVFKINMEAGHGGKSGRFQRLHEVAEEYAFMLDLVGIRE